MKRKLDLIFRSYVFALAALLLWAVWTEAQTNTVVRLNQSLFAKFTDYRASMGAELRIQVPILNVPFRLIYAYNPNARRDQIIDGFPFFFNEKKTVFRFSVGRTF